MTDTTTKLVVFAGGALLIYLFAKKMNVIKATGSTTGGQATNIGATPGATPGAAPGGSTVISQIGGATAAGGTMGATGGTVGIISDDGNMFNGQWFSPPVEIIKPDGTIVSAIPI